MPSNIRLAYVACRILPLILFSGSAFATGWELLTNKSHPDCTKESPCRVIESNGVFEFTMNSEVKESMKTLREVRIRNLKGGPPEIFELKEMNDIKQDEFFELYKIQLKPGVSGLALYAYSSAREGKSFYYFLYDTSKQKFTMSNGTFPKLNYNPQAKIFLTPVEGTKYILDKDLRLNPK